MPKYRLSCGHDIELERPVMVKGERLRCEIWPCGGMFRTINFIHGEYRIKCESCRYGRRFGRAKVTAEVQAVKHAIKYAHIVRLWRQGVDDECDVRHVGKSGKMVDSQDTLW